MITQKKQFFIGIMVAVIAAVIFGVIFFAERYSSPSDAYEEFDPVAVPEDVTVEPVTNKDHILGPASAEIVIYEYGDLECPFCKKFHPVMQQVFDAYGGRVAWVFRHFILTYHENAHIEAEASECAAELGGNAAFWRYIDTIYERTDSNGTGFSKDNLVPLAVEIGLDEDDFSSCLESGRHAFTVARQQESGTRAGVSGTPGTFVVQYGEKQFYISGAVRFEDIVGAIEAF